MKTLTDIDKKIIEKLVKKQNYLNIYIYIKEIK